jgi:hypothetical protein
MSEQVEQVLRMVDRELTVEEVASEAMQIELRIILGTHRPADLVRREVLRASRQHIQSQLDLTRRLLSTRRGVSLVLSGPGLEARIRKQEAALLAASPLMVEQDLRQQEQAQPDAAPSETDR